MWENNDMIISLIWFHRENKEMIMGYLMGYALW